MRSVPVGELRHLGDRAFLIGTADPASGRALAQALEAALAQTGEAEVLCGFATVAVLLSGRDTELEPVRVVAERVVAALPVQGGIESAPAGRLVTIPCTFDGPDLPEVAALIGCGPGEVVAHLTELPLTVAVVGFSPGFAYLDGLPEALRAVPRRARPRRRCPPAPSRSPTGTPPSTRRRLRAAGSSSVGPTPHSSHPSVLPTRCWPRGTGCT